MPTYLLAFVVSDLDFNSWYPINNKYRQRIYGRANVKSNLRESVLFSIEYLNILEQYVNFTYKLPHLYSAAVPDHGSAMENYVSIRDRKLQKLINLNSNIKELLVQLLTFSTSSLKNVD